MDMTWFQYTCMVGVIGWATGFLSCLGLSGLSATQRRRSLLGAIILSLLAVGAFLALGSCETRKDPVEAHRRDPSRVSHAEHPEALYRTGHLAGFIKTAKQEMW